MDQRGFSLVELLIAVAITAGSIAGIATMSLTAFERVERSGDLSTATSLAQQEIERIRALPYPSVPGGTTTETLNRDNERYERVTEIVVDQPETGIKEITVSVDTPSGRTVRLTSLVAE